MLGQDIKVNKQTLELPLVSEPTLDYTYTKPFDSQIFNQ
jgi:hypothetical protein